MASTTDDRVKLISRAAKTPLEKFIVVALLTILGAMGILEEVLSNLREAPANTDDIVGGKPFGHWVGKNEEQIRKELGDGEQTNEVLAAFKARGMSLDSGKTETKTTVKTAAKTSPPAKSTASEQQDGGKAGTAGTTASGTNAPPASDEQKIAGYKLSDLAGKTDEQLLAMENIGPKTVEAIRKAEKKLAASGTNAPPASESNPTA